ncbi:MAG TPA: hypothetical protein VIX81_06590 [Gammaproteobacteria bacterium]
MPVSASSYDSMTSDALTAYLFGLAVGCPLGIEAGHCPLRELHRGDLSNTYDHLIALTRRHKVELAEVHCHCARDLERGAFRPRWRDQPAPEKNR